MGGAPKSGGGGGGEGVRRDKELLVNITCNLAVPATHHRISTMPRI
jgi:hypothetical protein